MPSSIELVSQQEQKGVYIAQFKIKTLATFIYYVESDKECYIIDPSYDYLFYKDFIQKRDSKLKYIVLTHYHADYISGHAEFNVPVIMGEKSKRQINKFELIEMKDNEKFQIGKVQTRVLATPGHTPESACYVLADQDGHQFCIFTGDTVFLNEVGRPDLAVSGNISSQDLAGMLFESIQKIKSLDKTLRLYPGHGSGSSCGKSIGAGNFCDLKTQCEKNYALLIEDKLKFVETLTKDLPPPPKYFFHDAKINQQGSQIHYQNALTKIRNPLKVTDFQNILANGITIVDTRHLPQNGIIKGSYWISHQSPLCNLLSNVCEPDKQLALIIQKGLQSQILDRFLRIGYMNIVGFNDFDMSEWKGEKSQISLKKYDQIDHGKKFIAIDVRNKAEYIETGMFENAFGVPLTTLKARIDETINFVSEHVEFQIVVHCKTGNRARLAASILANHGVGPIITLNDNIDKLKQKGIKLVAYEEK